METKSTRGRKRLYEPEKLKIGEKMKLLGKMKQYPHSYCQSFNERGDEKYKVVFEGASVYLMRII